MVRFFSKCGTLQVRRTWENFETFTSKNLLISLNSDAAIIMFDLTSRVTYRNVPKWHKDLNRVASAIPVVIVGSKLDDSGAKVGSRELKYPKENDLPYFEISNLSLQNVDQPILSILKVLIGDSDLKLLPFPEDFQIHKKFSEEEVHGFYTRRNKSKGNGKNSRQLRFTTEVNYRYN